MDFVWDNPGEPMPEETFTHSHLSWSSIVPYLLHPSNTIHGVLPIQSTHLTIFFHNLQVFFGLPLGLAPSISYSIHLFPSHRLLFSACFAVVPRLCHLILVSLPLLGFLSCSFTPHIHLTILISARRCATSFSFLMGQVSLPCNIILRTQLLYDLPLTFNDVSLLVSNGTNCLNLFHPIHILFSTGNQLFCIFEFHKVQ